MLIRFSSLFLLAPLVATAATADIYKCSRTRIDDTGFKSMRAAESWYPKVVTVDVGDNLIRVQRRANGRFEEAILKEKQPDGKLKFYTTHGHTQDGQGKETLKLKFSLFANNKMNIQLGYSINYLEPGDAWYVCDITYNQPSKNSEPKPGASTNTGAKDKTAKSAVSSAMDRAKNTCEDLGFKPRTEKFGECVLRLLEN